MILKALRCGWLVSTSHSQINTNTCKYINTYTYKYFRGREPYENIMKIWSEGSPLSHCKSQGQQRLYKLNHSFYVCTILINKNICLWQHKSLLWVCWFLYLYQSVITAFSVWWKGLNSCLSHPNPRIILEEGDWQIDLHSLFYILEGYLIYIVMLSYFSGLMNSGKGSCFHWENDSEPSAMCFKNCNAKCIYTRYSTHILKINKTSKRQ